VSLPYVANSSTNEPLHLQHTFSRAEFERLVMPLVERTVQLCRETVRSAGITIQDVDDVLMVGGSSRIPIVHRLVEEFLQKKPCQGVNPDEAVAVGAALHANARTTNSPDIRLADVTPHALGIEIPNNGFHGMVPRNTRVPVEKVLTVTTSADYQDYLRFVVRLGESREANKNELLGEFVFSGLRRAPAREVEVLVTFSLDEDGIVHVIAEDAETNLRQSLVINSSSALTKAEVTQMKETFR
jgi:molecular chaperone DnaK